MTQETADAASAWADEAWPGVTTRYRLAKTLCSGQTPFQSTQIVDTEHYGRMLILDGVVQTTEKDEFVYHEMMTHVPMMAHDDPRRVLIIGGGDGGILREVLRHKQVERAVLVEIDQRVIDFCREYLPTISQGGFDDPRAEIVIADGAEHVRRTDQTFDVIIVDSPDPIGPAKTLFTQAFYRDLAARLGDGGIMTRQTGSTFMQPDELPQMHSLAAPLFRHAAGYVFSVPTYIGGLFTSLFCSDGIDPLDFDPGRAQRRFGALGRLRYYTPGVHAGAFQLPGYVAERLTAAPKAAPAAMAVTFGGELTLDLYDCDRQAISSEESIRRYAHELCEVIDMRPYGEPHTPYFGQNNEHTKGYSLLQFIETSSITAHFSEATGAAYVNIFSCKPYDLDAAEAFTRKFFGAKRVVTRYVARR